jgi:hypothetical protein
MKAGVEETQENNAFLFDFGMIILLCSLFPLQLNVNSFPFRFRCLLELTLSPKTFFDFRARFYRRKKEYLISATSRLSRPTLTCVFRCVSSWELKLENDSERTARRSNFQKFGRKTFVGCFVGRYVAATNASVFPRDEVISKQLQKNCQIGMLPKTAFLRAQT